MASDILDKIRGCWVGKCLGGVAGMPYEGVPEPPDLTEEKIVLNNVPNDDLELQLVWMAGLKKYGTAMKEREFAQLWLDHIPHGCDEYSVAERNLRHGIFPPASGWNSNFFFDGMGAAIRSEIWALLFAERLDAVAYFAAQDAQVDHWNDGVWGEIFMATAEARACLTGNLEQALRLSFESLPREGRLSQCLKQVFQLYDTQATQEEARRALLLHIQRHDNFTDCVMNLATVVYALLWGKGDFIKTILLAVNMGRDTDCTGASCGAFLGITYGMKAFPQKWISALDENLALSDYVSIIPQTPKTVTELANQTLELREKLHPLLEANYPSYTPYQYKGEFKSIDTSRWLILKNNPNTEQIEKALTESGKIPADLTPNIVEFSNLILDVTPFAGEACTLDLYSFLRVTDENTTPPEEIVLCAAADVGMTLWIDGIRYLNHHSRRKMIPAFHRTEGGATFHYPLKKGDKKLVHIRLYNCMPPLKCCFMVGNLYNDHLDGFPCSIQ